MNAIIQTQLDRIESALTSLVDSIAAYSPSTVAANTLLAADDELQVGLKQLSQHQRNHLRILALHERISHQNAQITSILTSLAETRADLLSTPTSLPRKGTRNVPYTELLDYAKRISRYTVPPTFRPPLPLPRPQIDSTVNGDIENANAGDEEGRGRGTEALEDEEKKWLEPLMQIPFAPWVSDDVIKRGALAQIQAMVEKGEDPDAIKPTEAENEAGESGAVGENMGNLQNEGTAVSDLTGTKEGEKKQERRVAKPEVFGGLDLYDPSNPDEDG